jgi:hypothetical protein
VPYQLSYLLPIVKRRKRLLEEVVAHPPRKLRNLHNVQKLYKADIFRTSASKVCSGIFFQQDRLKRSYGIGVLWVVTPYIVVSGY